MKFFVNFILLIFTLSISLFAAETKTTQSGYKFVKVSEAELIKLGIKDVKNFGEAWEDENKVIWGDIAPDFKNQYDAETYCKVMGAKLPKNEDFQRLREYMGACKENHNGYEPQVLPNLTYEQDRYVSKYFWSASVRAANSGEAYYFGGRSGAIYYYARSLDYFVSVRCVVR